MSHLPALTARFALAASAFIFATPVSAAPVLVTLTIENLAPANSISFAPLRLGFNNGTFDSFNEGDVSTAPIISVAEGGSGSDWIPAFMAADPTAVVRSSSGPITPGSTVQTMTFLVDTAVNRFFTFASMVVPSNDFFVGNDDPMEYELFDAAGNLLLTSITETASDIWNAGSEAFDPANAAFLVNGINALRTPENGVVGFNFSELTGFDGLTTAAGYVFNSQLTADSNILRISFNATPVPEPATFGLMAAGLAGIGAAARRRRTPASKMLV